MQNELGRLLIAFGSFQRVNDIKEPQAFLGSLTKPRRGVFYSWRALLEARRAQLEAWEAAQPRQPALFTLRTYCRPQPERSAAGRYCEPTLLALLQGRGGE